MSTLEQLKNVSLQHFALHGYEGASLAHIANDVGIKKQSIYTYFKTKDDLFLYLYEDACKREMTMVVENLKAASNSPVNIVLHQFLEQSITRFLTHDSTKFVLRSAFLPPDHLQENVLSKAIHYLNQLEELFIPIFEQAKENGEISETIDIERATSAFLGVLDSLYVELLYGDEHRLQKRFDASWYMFWMGLTSKE